MAESPHCNQKCDRNTGQRFCRMVCPDFGQSIKYQFLISADIFRADEVSSWLVMSGSLSLLLMKKFVWQFVSDSQKAVKTLTHFHVTFSNCLLWRFLCNFIGNMVLICVCKSTPYNFCLCDSSADVISIAKTNENFWLLYDSKGWFTLHHIDLEGAKVLTLLLFCSFFSHTYAEVLIAVISFNCDWLYMCLTLFLLCFSVPGLLLTDCLICWLCSISSAKFAVPNLVRRVFHTSQPLMARLSGSWFVIWFAWDEMFFLHVYCSFVVCFDEYFFLGQVSRSAY